MPAVQSSSNLVELIQALQAQQQDYAEATQALARTLEDQLRQHAQASATIAGTLEQISGLLSALVGGLASVVPGPPRAAAAAQPQAAPKLGTAAKAGGGAVSAKTAPAKGEARSAGGQQTGTESVLAFVKQRTNPTSAEIAAHWKSQGRGGAADNVLTQLVKDKVLERRPNESGRGSRYVLI